MKQPLSGWIKNFSFQNVTQRLWSTFKRFPLVIAATTLGTVCALVFIHYSASGSYDSQKEIEWIKELPNVMLVLHLGFPWLIAVAVFLESCLRNKALKACVHAGSVLVLVGYYFFLKSGPVEVPSMMIMYLITTFVVYGLAFSMLLLPDYKNSTHFWEKVYQVVVRTFFTGAFTAIAFMGFTAIWSSLNYLFKFDSRYLGQLIPSTWVILVGIVGVIYFLAGFPKAYSESKKSYPKFFTYLVQYILVPLLAIYALILYGYAAKILVTHTWPLGGVVELILCYSIVGLVTFLWSYPLWSVKENKKIRTFFTSWFLSLLPLLMLYFVAIGLRLQDYGVTVARYYIVLAGVWVFGTTLYFVIDRKKNVGIVPVSLTVLAFLSLWGPWSSFNVSIRSQMNRLESKLTQNGMLQNGKFQKASTSTMSIQDSGQISSIVQYLADYNALDKLQPWFNEPIQVIAQKDQNKTNTYMQAQNVLTYMHIDGYNYARPYYTFASPLNAYQGVIPSMSVSGYDWLVFLELYDNSSHPYSLKDNNQSMNVIFAVNRDTIQITLPSKAPMTVSLTNTIKQLIEKYGNSYNVPLEALTIEQTQGNVHVKMFINTMSIQQDAGGFKIVDFRAHALLKFDK